MKYIDQALKDVRELIVGYYSLPDEYKNKVAEVKIHIITYKHETNLLEKLLLALPSDAKLVYINTHAVDLTVRYYFASTEFPVTPEFLCVPEVEVWLSKEQGPFSADKHKSWKVKR